MPGVRNSNGDITLCRCLLAGKRSGTRDEKNKKCGQRWPHFYVGKQLFSEE